MRSKGCDEGGLRRDINAESENRKKVESRSRLFVYPKDHHSTRAGGERERNGPEKKAAGRKGMQPRHRRVRGTTEPERFARMLRYGRPGARTQCCNNR